MTNRQSVVTVRPEVGGDGFKYVVGRKYIDNDRDVHEWKPIEEKY